MKILHTLIISFLGLSSFTLCMDTNKTEKLDCADIKTFLYAYSKKWAPCKKEYLKQRLQEKEKKEDFEKFISAGSNAIEIKLANRDEKREVFFSQKVKLISAKVAQLEVSDDKAICAFSLTQDTEYGKRTGVFMYDIASKTRTLHLPGSGPALKLSSNGLLLAIEGECHDKCMCVYHTQTCSRLAHVSSISWPLSEKPFVFSDDNTQLEVTSKSCGKLFSLFNLGHVLADHKSLSQDLTREQARILKLVAESLRCNKKILFTVGTQYHKPKTDDMIELDDEATNFYNNDQNDEWCYIKNPEHRSLYNALDSLQVSKELKEVLFKQIVLKKPGCFSWCTSGGYVIPE